MHGYKHEHMTLMEIGINVHVHNMLNNLQTLCTLYSTSLKDAHF